MSDPNELTIQPEAFDWGIRLRLEGNLDGCAAYKLRDHISRLSAPVIVDCSRLGQMSDFGLGILAMAINEMEREVQFVGLGYHGTRILKAFGLSGLAQPSATEIQERMPERAVSRGRP